MGLKNKIRFFTTEARRSTHGGGYVQETEEVDVSDAHFIRVLIDLIGKDALTTGSLRIGVFGILGGVETTVPALFVDVTATGLTRLIDANILFNVRGLESIKLKFSYTRVATDYVDFSGIIGVPDPQPAK